MQHALATTDGAVPLSRNHSCVVRSFYSTELILAYAGYLVSIQNVAFLPCSSSQILRSSPPEYAVCDCILRWTTRPISLARMFPTFSERLTQFEDRFHQKGTLFIASPLWKTLLPVSLDFYDPLLTFAGLTSVSFLIWSLLFM